MAREYRDYETDIYTITKGLQGLVGLLAEGSSSAQTMVELACLIDCVAGYAERMKNDFVETIAAEVAAAKEAGPAA